MIFKGARLTAGLLAGVLLVTSIPAQTLASVPAEAANYITTTAGGFTAGAHSAINETVVLDDTQEGITLASSKSMVAENGVPVVAMPAKEDAYEDIAIANVDVFLNIRAEANEDAEVLGKLYKNGAARVLETLDGWYKVKSGKVTGYVSADYVIVGDEATCRKASTRIGKITTNSVRLRKEASADAAVCTLVGEGHEVKVVDESSEEWIKVKFGEYTGYVSADYVNLECKYTYAESKEEEAARLAAEEEARRREEEERRREEEQRRPNNGGGSNGGGNKKPSNNGGNQKDEDDYKPPTGGSGQAVANYAVQFVGNPYVWGGESLTRGADCSGFVKAVYKKFGVSLPHSSSALRRVGRSVSASNVKAGDIICYSGHVAIYIGGGRIVHASNRRDGIKISNNWRYRTVLAIRRIF